jgi:ABC-2 type transport system permease protein
MTQSAVFATSSFGPVATAQMRDVFIAATRSEWTKLRTVRSTIWALVATVVFMLGFSVLFPALEVSRWDQRTPVEVAGFDPSLYSFAGINLAQASIGVLGVLVMTSEYARNAIRLTFAATPQRGILLGAKVAAFSGAIALVGILSCLPAFLIGQAIFGPRHGGLSIADPDSVRVIAAAALYLVLIGLIGIAVGALVRHTAAAIAILFVMLLVVPGLVSPLPRPWNDNVMKFLPSSAGTAMGAVVDAPSILSPLAGFVVLMAYTVAILGFAGLAISRRDA